MIDKQIEPMNQEEMSALIRTLLSNADHHPRAVDGLIFLLQSLSIIGEKHISLIDLCDALIMEIYNESFHQSVAERIYVESISHRYRSTDYNRSCRTINQEVRDEVNWIVENNQVPIIPAKDETDKSNLEDLSRQISEIMHNPHLPRTVYHALGDDLSTNFLEADFYSPENVLSNLKEVATIEKMNEKGGAK